MGTTTERPAWLGTPEVQALCDAVHAATEKRALRFEKRMRFTRWLETEDGDANGGTFCPPCAVKVQRKRKKEYDREKVPSRDRYDVIGGWDEAPEVDCRDDCEECGRWLFGFLTEYGVTEELTWYSDPLCEELGDREFYELWEMTRYCGELDRRSAEQVAALRKVAERFGLMAG